MTESKPQPASTPAPAPAAPPPDRKRELLGYLGRIAATFPCRDLAAWNKVLPVVLAPRGADDYAADVAEDPLVSRVELTADFAKAGGAQALAIDFRTPVEVTLADLAAELKLSARADGAAAVFVLSGGRLTARFESGEALRLTAVVFE